MKTLVLRVLFCLFFSIAPVKGYTASTSCFDDTLVVAPLAPPLLWSDHRSTPDAPMPTLPLPDALFVEHVRCSVQDTDAAVQLIPEKTEAFEGISEDVTTLRLVQDAYSWVGTSSGLFIAENADGPYTLHAHYGDGKGPLSSHITGMCLDSQDTLWITTVAGLSARNKSGNWISFTGRSGLPVEELTCIAVDAEDCLWIGSQKGLIHFLPNKPGSRQWLYLQGQRYLPDDYVEAVAVSENGTVLVRTGVSWNAIESVKRTLKEKADYLLDRYVERHRRLGMPSPAQYEAPDKMEAWTHAPQPSDGLWTSYHVTSMALAYSLTGEERYKELAREGMEALYKLQNITGIPGLVARSMVAIDEPTVPELSKQKNWHKTADGNYLWRDDVSSDQITGHFFAFYTYYEHIAKNDPVESEKLKKQLRQVLDYILDHNYQIIDWDGKRTLWGWWNPEMLQKPEHYLERGLYSLMMLGFLKTAHYITGDEKYLEHYEKLILEHDYLSMILLQKKVFPDELNHSDDQLSALAFYIYLQTEQDPCVRDVLHRELRRHARIELPERNSLLTLVYATIDPEDADIEGSLQTLREIPLDRRNWRQENSHRKDIVLQKTGNVRDQILTLDVLPADERHFERWNADPYVADTGGDGTSEGSGVHWMLAYWLARYHGFLDTP